MSLSIVSLLLSFFAGTTVVMGFWYLSILIIIMALRGIILTPIALVICIFFVVYGFILMNAMYSMEMNEDWMDAMEEFQNR